MVDFNLERSEKEEEPETLEDREEIWPEESEIEQLEEEESPSIQESLEELVAENPELPELPADQDYFDETSLQVEYHQPEEASLLQLTYTKEALDPLAYEDREIVVVVDIFERYSSTILPQDDKWWKKPKLF